MSIAVLLATRTFFVSNANNVDHLRDFTITSTNDIHNSNLHITLQRLAADKLQNAKGISLNEDIFLSA